jgi:hypothetical protein
MFNLILIISAFAIFITSFIMILMELFSSKENDSQEVNLKIPKSSGRAFFMTFFALLLLVIVSFSYVPLG